ncbi:hypothetical protein Ancab_040636 [Ancistrocladus abbreviatus]
MHLRVKGKDKGKGKASSSILGTSFIDDMDYVSLTSIGGSKQEATHIGDRLAEVAESPTLFTDETVPFDACGMNLTGNLLAAAELHPNILWFNHGLVVRNITKSIQSKFDGPYTSWSSTPLAVQDCWWKFFRDQYRWDPSIATDVLSGFKQKAATCLEDIVYKLSRVKENKIISWCSSLVRQQLKKRRESEEFQNKSKIYSANKTSGEHGNSLHTQGSTSTPKMMRQMVRGGWTQKGEVYGLGSGAHLCYERSTFVSHSTNSFVCSSEIRSLEQRIEKLQAEKVQMKAQMEEQNRMILALKNAMEASGILPCFGQWPPFSSPPSPPPPPPCPPPLT